MFDKLVRFSAQIDPHGVAVSSGDMHLDYRQFDQRIDQLAVALQRGGMPAADRFVAINVRDPLLHALLILACARLRVATVSLVDTLAAPMWQASGADYLLSDDPAFAAGSDRAGMQIDDAWTAFAFGLDVTPVILPDTNPTSLSRLQFSSGTTGHPKVCELSWATMASRVDHTWNRDQGITRVMTLLGPEVGALQILLCCWSRGGCVLFGSRDTAILAHSLRALRPTGLLASPSQLAGLIDAWPAEAAPLEGLTIVATGAWLTSKLRSGLARLSQTVLSMYSSTEAGITAMGMVRRMGDDRAVGWTMPWTEVEIVDGTSAPVQQGTEGRVRLRSADLVCGYRGGESFDDGWFYPGDLGSLSEEGLLRIHGREDELMNFGGCKYLPDVIEQPVRDVPGVADVAAFAVSDANGIEHPWLAVVRSDPTLTHGAIGAVLHFPDLPPVNVAWIDVLPRTPTGKIMRDHLRQAVLAR